MNVPIASELNELKFASSLSKKIKLSACHQMACAFFVFNQF